MGISDLGTFRISNLRDATGVASNSLPTIHPGASGTAQPFSDYIIGALGTFDSESSPQWQATMQRDGSGTLNNGDTFDCIIEVGNYQALEGAAPAEALDQIVANISNWSVDSNVQNGCSFDSLTYDAANSRVIATFTVTGYDSLDAAIVFDDGMHTGGASGVENFGVALVFATNDVQSGTPRIQSVQADVVDQGAPNWDVTLTPSIYDPAGNVGTPYYSYYKGQITASDHPGNALVTEAGPSTETITVTEAESGNVRTFTIVMSDGTPLTDDSNVKDIFTFEVDLTNTSTTQTFNNATADTTF